MGYTVQMCHCTLSLIRRTEGREERELKKTTARVEEEEVAAL